MEHSLRGGVDAANFSTFCGFHAPTVTSWRFAHNRLPASGPPIEELASRPSRSRVSMAGEKRIVCKRPLSRQSWKYRAQRNRVEIPSTTAPIGDWLLRCGGSHSSAPADRSCSVARPRGAGRLQSRVGNSKNAAGFRIVFIWDTRLPASALSLRNFCHSGSAAIAARRAARSAAS